MMPLDQLIQIVAIGAIPILFALAWHEAAHGYAARHFGDMSAYQMGRLTLNPAHHIDPIGTILLPITTLWLGGILIGWAKPTPVNFGALRHPKKDMFWVSVAGPAANLAMALVWGLVLKFAMGEDGYFAAPLAQMAKIGIQINVVLVALNLLPLPPLDGGRVAISLLPHRQAYQLARIEPYGFIILIILLVTNVLWLLLWPVMSLLNGLINFIFGL